MSTITLEAAAVGRGLDAAVPPLTVTITPGTVSVVQVETDERPLLVSMLLAGRLRPDSGRVLIDSRADAAALRTAVALVDTPVVAEPSAAISLAITVAEEFAFAGLPSSRRAVQNFLNNHHLGSYTRLAVRALPAADRVRLFAELAVLRPRVTCIVVTSPERHGAAAERWLPALTEIANRGIAVVVVTDAATAAALFDLGARDATRAIEPTAESDRGSHPLPGADPESTTAHPKAVQP